MFVDLVDSSAFSSVLGLKEYADYVDAFHTVVWVQCEYFFKRYLRGKYKEGRDYEFIVIGDQLVFFLHTAKSANDVYLLATLGITLKAAWIAIQAALSVIPRVARRYTSFADLAVCRKNTNWSPITMNS